MKTIPLTKPVRPRRLRDELVAAVPGLRPFPGPPVASEVFDITDTALVVPDDVDEAAVEQVVAAHDPSRLSDSEQQQENETAIRDALLAALATLENAATWPPRTQAEKTEILRRIEVRLIRLVLRRLDTAG